MDNGTTGRLAHGPRSIAIVGHATGYLFAELRGYCRTALSGRRLLPVIRSSDRRRRGMRLARALGSLPHLRRQFVPTARSRVVRGRLQWNFSTGVEQPAHKVSSVEVKPPLADQTPLASSLMLWATRVLIAGLVVVTLIPTYFLELFFAPGICWQSCVGDGQGGASMRRLKAPLTIGPQQSSRSGSIEG